MHVWHFEQPDVAAQGDKNVPHSYLQNGWPCRGVLNVTESQLGAD
jgi:hypothetical protein